MVIYDVISFVVYFYYSCYLMIPIHDDTNPITDSYLYLLEYESKIESHEDLVTFTEEQLIPSMEGLLQQAKDVAEKYDEEELLEVHDLLIRSYELLVEGNQEWLQENRL